MAFEDHKAVSQRGSNVDTTRKGDLFIYPGMSSSESLPINDMDRF